MRSGMIAVWDPDQEYTEKLGEYLRRQGGMGSVVVSFSDRAKLQRAVEQGQVAVTILGGQEDDEEWRSGIPTLRLTEDRTAAAAGYGMEGIPWQTGTRARFYKYQPARRILRILSEMQQPAVEPMPGDSPQAFAVSVSQEVGQPARIRGIYAPLGGCLKTSLGLVMGCLLAEESRCLFVSLEAHAGFRTLFGRQYPVDLSDLFALVRQGGNLMGTLSEAMQPFGKLQYIPPVIWPVDVREAEFAELKDLLQRLALCGRFDEIILDVGQDLACPEKILQLCDLVYQPEKEDIFSRAKLAEYEAYLRISGYEGLWERTRRIPLSRLAADLDGGSLDQWQRWEQMIPVVRQILEENGDEG